jgi:RNA polymerase sigma factor (sigma-70 family)
MADSLATVRATASEPDGHADGHSAVRAMRPDAAGFDRLVADHRERIARLAYRLLGWRDEVEDVVQEVFLAALRNREAFRAESRLTTWLTTIAINKCRSHLRRRLLRLVFFARSRPRLAAAVDGAERAALERESFEQVRRALQKLPTRCREVVVLRYLEEMPILEIAEVLGISRNAVEVRLNRARARLRADLAVLVEQ